MIKYICVVLLMVYLFHKKRFILQRKYRTVNQALLLFGGTVLFSSIHMLTIHFPPGFKEVSPLSGVLLVLCVACSFFMMEYVNEKNLHQSFFILMYRFTLGYLLVNDLLLLAQMPSVSGMESSTIIYLIGNKFEVTYMHLFFSALYYQVFCTGMKVYLRQYIILVMHLVLTLFIAIGVECSTGVLGVVLLAVFLFLYKKIRFIFRPFFAIILMLLFGAFFLLYETILAIPSVQYLIVDILNEDLTLTGRTYIYTRMLDLMDTQPWFGYGNGTATFFTTYYIHEKLTNTQNGLLNDYIDWENGVCKFDGERFKDLLNFCNQGTYLDNDSEQNETEQLRMDKVLLTTASIGAEDVEIYRSVFGEEVSFVGYPGQEEGETYFSFQDVLGMSVQSENKEGVWQFLKMFMMLDYQGQIQDAGLINAGIPTREDAFEMYMKTRTATEDYTDEFGVEISPMKYDWGDGDVEISVTPLTLDEEKQFRNLVSQTHLTGYYEETVMGIVEEESSNYFYGQQSLDKTIQVIQDRVTKYVNENR